ncbi:altronate dehydratase family protein [Marinobacter sp. M3C]|jgi:altronate hydrolase/galactarate dehydratase|uniref:UxaA family hydrolase n=1 Tax=Marinobacter sp. M3C TaxID=2917715 RepID=UPI0020102DAB|nr:altronate dehydratase family protein [Marinobacter sp. M3C]UQG59278.1 altronate dehydratase family protein [Marinobacter sp. M3C]
MQLITPNQPVLILSDADSVAVARKALASGSRIENLALDVVNDIPSGHKIARHAIAEGEAVIKYGQVIGIATQHIPAGAHVHTHNVAMPASHASNVMPASIERTAVLPPDQRRHFMGYRRADGRVGTRNYIAILSTVNCSATVARAVAAHFDGSELLKQYNIDGVVALTHGSGCAINTDSDGFKFLERSIWGYACNSNIAGAVLIGLGCETNQISSLLKRYNISEGPNFRVFNIQNVGGTRASIARAIEQVNEVLTNIGRLERTSESVEHLMLGLQCGGSDGYSGISANPALGYAADLLVRNGGTAILSETPEIYGAEHMLIARAISQEVGQKLLDRLTWWEHYTRINGAELNNNPSPGNKAGGLTTILEKSLGATAKSGTTSLNDVYEWGEPITEHGFVFMDSPGYDPVSVTGQVASGANMICFTTGRGSVSGFKPAPCIKLATNTDMYRRLEEDMDINCGGIVDGELSVADAGKKIFDILIEIASGRQSKSEQYNYGDNEFVPWQVGAVT